MLITSLRRLARPSLFVCAFLCSCSAALAQNENETVGFRPNHAFESGQFGENIDTLNGGLNFDMPLGQRYQVNSRLGYGLILSYNSKVWDTTYFKSSEMIPNQNERIVPANEGPFGIGFSAGFGRIFVDYQYNNDASGASYRTRWTSTWKWVSPDGSQHEFYVDSGLQSPPWTEPNVTPEPLLFWNRLTNDLSYTM